jgi:ubiquitin carboxyl-terminal hydrolase L5
VTDSSDYEAELVSSPPTKSVDKAPLEPRRNPKRKAAEAAVENFDLPENILDESLAPLRPNEQDEWHSWIEIESEPVGADHFWPF